jgi:RNA polymerase subunit RPABC4/transcription elongation factor Spt4
MYRLLIIQIIAGIVGAIVANKKGRNYGLWFLLCFFFPPMFFLILMLPPKLTQGRTKSCPYCSRIIPEDETVCRYCMKEQPINLVECKECGSFVPEKNYCMQCNKKLKS